MSSEARAAGVTVFRWCINGQERPHDRQTARRKLAARPPEFSRECEGGSLSPALRTSRLLAGLSGGRGCVVGAVGALVLFVLALSGVAAAQTTDRDVLMALYNATAGPNWTNNTNWGSTEDIGDWYGVGTDNTDTVAQLHLSGNNLSGTIPAEIGHLTALSNLDLSGNNLSGTIPAEIGHLTALVWLYLNNNAALSGALPESFPSGLPNLRELHIQGTRVTVPTDVVFAAWLGSIELRTGGTTTPAVYLPLSEDTDPLGLWSDGTTLWAVEDIDAALYAYRLATGGWEERRDITLAAVNADPYGLWSDRSRVWVADTRDAKLYAYRLATGAREERRDITLAAANADPRGLWSDGTTLWVADAVDFQLYAYRLATGAREERRDITLAAANVHPRGLWSDGTTLWVADAHDTKLYAYSLTTGNWEQAKDVLLSPANDNPSGIWSNGTTWWVADTSAVDAKIYRYGPAPPVPRPPVPRPPGGGSVGARDLHGDSPAQASAVQVGRTAPWASATAGQVNSASDVDYFELTLPQAGVLVVETTWSTDTVGTVWQAGVELGMADSGGELRNFRLRVPVEPGPVVIAVEGQGSRTGSYRLETHLVVGYLENPGADSFQSGIGVLSGWVCAADEIEIEIGTERGEVERQTASYGTERLDTADICGDTDNGFGLLFNWNLLRDGEHEVVAYVDGVELGRATVTVTTLGAEFLRGVAGECSAEDFPHAGERVRLVWQQNQQNFVVAEGSQLVGIPSVPAASVTGFLENPGPDSFQSGIGVISGWVCAADEVEITLGDLPRQRAAYGTERLDTHDACGDTNNGFGLLFNWNLLGDGEHAVVAYVDDEELGRATVRVTTLGAEFLRGAVGACVVADFPLPGETVTLAWQQNSQNFVIAAIQ